MKQGFLLLCVVVLAQATNLKDTQWEQFKAKYMKDYEPEEESTRKTIWANNHAFIKRHNEAYEAGNETYTVGENEYTDLTNMEFASMLTSMQATMPSSRDTTRRMRQGTRPMRWERT